MIGLYNGLCSKEWTGSCSGSQYISGIPYGKQTEEDALFYEDGYKGVRGYLTEGRYLVFESNGYALSNPEDDGSSVSASEATTSHDSVNHRWVLHATTAEGTTFKISSAVDGKYMSQDSSLAKSVDDAETYKIVYFGSSQYTIQKEDGTYLNIGASGSVTLDQEATPYSIFSVTYNS